MTRSSVRFPWCASQVDAPCNEGSIAGTFECCHQSVRKPKCAVELEVEEKTLAGDILGTVKLAYVRPMIAAG